MGKTKEVEKRLKRVEKEVESHGSSISKLSKTEQDVLTLLTNDYLTPKQVSIRRGTSDKAVYKTIKNLKKKGAIHWTLKKVEKNQCTFQPSQPKGNQIRLHCQEFNIRILYKDEKYKSKVGKVIFIDGNTIRLYRNSIEVYSGHSFYGDDTQKVTANSMKYWSKFFIRLESNLKVILIKPRVENITIVNNHYSETNNELAIECNKKADKIRIYASEDHKLCFLIDNSLNLNEFESTHHQTAEEDMKDTIKAHFTDLRDKKPPLPSEVYKMLSEIAIHEKELAAGLNVMVTYLKSQIPKETPISKQDKPNYIG